MKNFQWRFIWPHILAVLVFLFVTIVFFSPVFFDNKVIDQADIQQFRGASKSILDHREATGQEPLWAPSVFSGMPAYLLSVYWGDAPLRWLKRIMTLFLPHGIGNIFLAFICYYILLLSFRVRPFLAIAGALAFGLCSYLIIGLSVGHNSRIGAIAVMPLVMAGIHLVFSNKKILGFGVTIIGLALHLRENHLQITYYLVLIVVVYGLIRLIEAVRVQMIGGLIKKIGILVVAAVIGAGTFFGPFWSITEYTSYSTRGPAELAPPGTSESGLTKEYAFAYKYGIWEPMTLLIPQFYGGTSGRFFASDPESESYNALVSSGNQAMINQLANYTSAYWGPQSYTAGPYYAGAIIIFLFAIGILFAKRKYVWWLVSLSALSLMLSWGDSFASFNYFMFDYLPGYNKFRSVSFGLVIILFAMPLLGFMGLEKLLSQAVDRVAKKKMLIAFSVTGGLCLLLLLFAGMFDFTREFESELPDWFTSALAEDRKGLFRADAFRSFVFISLIFVVLYFDLARKLPVAFYAFLILITVVDLVVVDKRYFTESNFIRKRDRSFLAETEADKEILKDKSYYRVYNLNNPFSEARTSYYHRSIGGYHGAKIRRYQEFYDSCLVPQTQAMIDELRQGIVDFRKFGGMNMLNVKYVTFGPERNNVVLNRDSNGPAWFVQKIVAVNSPAEELKTTCGSDTRTTAVIDGKKFSIPEISYDSAGSITLSDHKANYLKFESKSSAAGLAVFSEIYYPGWVVTIDGKEATVLRANYILRALEIPAGNHIIEMKFEPRLFVVGNKVTTASTWLAVVILLGSIILTLREKQFDGKNPS